VVLQSGYVDWLGELGTACGELEGAKMPPNVYVLGNCPHEWLFPRVAACVHHGGAGTVAASLRAGRPTLVCPFFGDQHMWGAMVHRCGAGPQPVPISAVNAASLTEAFRVLKDPATAQGAAEQAAAYAKEDGVDSAVAAFHRKLPLDRMLCEVSLMLPGSRAVLGRYATDSLGVRVSAEVHAVLAAALDPSVLPTFIPKQPNADAAAPTAVPPDAPHMTKRRRRAIVDAFGLCCRAHHAFAWLLDSPTPDLSASTDGARPHVATAKAGSSGPYHLDSSAVPAGTGTGPATSADAAGLLRLATLRELVRAAEERGCRSLQPSRALRVFEELLQGRDGLSTTEWCLAIKRVGAAHRGAAAAAIDELLAPACSERAVEELLVKPLHTSSSGSSWLRRWRPRLHASSDGPATMPRLPSGVSRVPVGV